MRAIHIVTPPKNGLERLTSGAVFAVLFTLSVLLVMPLLLLGLVLAVLMIADADAGSVPALGLVGGGIAGLVGLFRGRTRAWPLTAASVEVTIVCLAAGMAAALLVLGTALVLLVLGTGPAMERTAPLEEGALALWALVSMPHTVLLVAGLASLERLPRHYLKMTGEPFDSVPVICLLVALGLSVSAVLTSFALGR